ncbi:hypothetical protein ELQ92_11775 [Labedella populi]|uniref:DUF2975 domain-containing protein n=1 Tax=Labedella populi TaxID=2498850 RepID=A0A444Q6I5_9MICO|nr:hypothetical protein [Labedella populi]RWZ59512.1 hypothetical protein ELQ92_11775 [Labedella populi]
MRFRSTIRETPTGLTRADTFALWLFTGVTAFFGVAVLVSAIPAIVELFGDEVPFSLSASQNVPPDAASGTARIVSGSFDRAQLLVSGVELWPRIALAVSIALASLCSAAVAATVVALCLGILSGRPFVRSVTWVLTTASLVLIAGSLLGAFFNTMAMFSIVAAINPDPSDTVFPFASEYDFTALLIGLVFGAVATAFQLGQRMQRDTDGLV